VLTYLALGATYAFAAAVQPGPYQTYLISQALSHGWRRTLPAALAPLLSDVPIILLVLVVLSRLPLALEQVLRCAGGVFLLYLAWRAFRAWRQYRLAPATSAATARRSLLSAAVVNLLNPNPYLGWSLVMGPLLLRGWHEAPASGIALLVAFYGAMVVASMGIIVLFAGARSLGPRVARGLVGASAAALACFGCWQLWSGASGLLGGLTTGPG
jgi:threonine/homoserine/homoserine lactone efflux protein